MHVNRSPLMPRQPQRMPLLLALSRPFVTAIGPLTLPRRPLALALCLAVALLGSGMASAFSAPAVGDFGYDVYDIVVNQILTGPIGFIGGVALIVFGATQIMKNWFSTILCIIAGTVLIRADALVVTLGYTVN